MSRLLALVQVGLLTVASACVPQAGDQAPRTAATPPSAVRNASGNACPEMLLRRGGPSLRRASASDLRRVSSGGAVACLWEVGRSNFDTSDIAVFLAQDENGFRALKFVRDKSVYLGSLDLPDGAVASVEGRDVVVSSRSSSVRLPLLRDGPAPSIRIEGQVYAFEPSGADMSDVAYSRALREPMGARRGGCRVAGLREAPETVRRGLAAQRAMRPVDLDGDNCIWAVGTVTADDGRRFGLYIWNVQTGLNPHWSSDLFVLENDRTYLGAYPQVTPEPMRTDGSNLIVDSEAGSERVHFGAGGPPAKIVIAGDLLTYVPARP